MRYHYFIHKAHDNRNPHFDLFVLVPNMRISSKRQCEWHQFVGKHSLNAFLSIPLDDTSLRFSHSSKEIGGIEYPVLRIMSTSYGGFHVPFSPSKIGQHQLEETYSGIKSLIKNYVSQRKQRVSEQQASVNKATGTDGAMAPHKVQAGALPAPDSQHKHQDVDNVVSHPSIGNRNQGPQITQSQDGIDSDVTGTSRTRKSNDKMTEPERGSHVTDANDTANPQRTLRQIQIMRSLITGITTGVVGMLTIILILLASSSNVSAAETLQAHNQTQEKNAADHSNASLMAFPVPSMEATTVKANHSPSCGAKAAYNADVNTIDPIDGLNTSAGDGEA